ncbi:FAD-dependent oxidoreductase [Herbaspirillum sp. GCM10030257]|uniref:FAD-dependent oxidoreductase n=1 Tax=Herbaspirillum sp. GCM10030257 TaxID=3273393 RepID=UPI003612ADF8
MATYQVRLTHSKEIATGTMAFHFNKPHDFNFKPGQAVDLVLINPESQSAEPLRHTFSIASAPYQEGLEIATRMRDTAYKRLLRELKSGTAATIEGPFGSLTLHKDIARPAVFIAGGIGITPFISILRQATRDKTPQQLVLLYTNRRPEDSAYLDELQRLDKQNERFQLVATMTDIGRSVLPWKGKTRSLDTAFVEDATGGLVAPIFYTAGPPGMVETVRSILAGIGASENDIRSEDFYGY